MLAAAAMGATAFQKGLGAIHSLSHPIGAVYDTHHGLTNAVVMPYVLVFNRPAIEPKIERLAAWLGIAGRLRRLPRLDPGPARRARRAAHAARRLASPPTASTSWPPWRWPTPPPAAIPSLSTLPAPTGCSPRRYSRGSASSPAAAPRASSMQTAMLVDSLWVLLTRLVMRAANFAVFLLLARSLTVGEFGFYGYVMSTALVLAIAFDLGLRQSGAWLIGQEPGAEPRRRHPPDGPVAGVEQPGRAGLLADAGGRRLRRRLWRPGAGGGLNVAPMLCLRTGQGVFLGRGELGKLNRSELISRAVMLAGTIGLWAAGLLDLGTAIWVLLGAHVAAAAYLLLPGPRRPAPGAPVPAGAGRPHAALRRRAVDRGAAHDPARVGSASGWSAGDSARMRSASISARSGWARSWSRWRPRSGS